MNESQTKHSVEFLHRVKISTDLIKQLLEVNYSQQELKAKLIKLTGKKHRSQLSLDELNDFIDHLTLLLKVAEFKDKNNVPLRVGSEYQFFKRFYILIDVNNGMAMLENFQTHEKRIVPCHLLTGCPF